MSGYSILIVDDEQFVREHFQKYIPWAESGFIWMGAAVHGQQALQMMELALPDIVLTDITMPVMDGISFAKQVRERWPQVRIIFLTAHDEFAYAQQAIGLGAKNYLLKMGLSKEKIIEACQQAVADIYHLDRKQAEKEEWWNKKKTLLETWLYHQPIPNSINNLEPVLQVQDQYYVYGSIICDWHNQISNAKDLELLQRKIADKIESWTTERVPNIKTIVFPLGDLQLLIQLSIPQRFGMKVMQQLVHQFQNEIIKEMNQLFNVNCAVLISSIGANMNECHTKFSIAVQKAEQYFYAMELEHSSDRYELANYSRVQQLEKAAKITKLMGQSDWAAFLMEVNQLTRLQQPLSSPLYLLNVARMILDHRADMPDHLFQHLSLKLKLITVWKQYCEWWQQLIEGLSIPLHSLHERMNVRKEIHMICERIAVDYNKEISIRMLADELRMNAAYLGQLFKQETGEYLSDYIIKVRIKRAKELLQNSDLKVYEVAQNIGMEDYRYFCKVFKAHVGTTPTAYKRCIL